MSKLSRLSHLGLAKETVQGTPVAPTAYLPVDAGSLKPEDVIAPIRDESLRANDSVLQAQYGGPSESTFAFNGRIYPDTFGHLPRAIIGVDTVGAPVSSIYPHVFKTTGVQPPSYTLTDYDLVEARAYPGCMLSELGIHVDVKGDVTYDTKWSGWPSATASTPVPAFTTLQPFLGWQLTWSAATISSTRVLSTDLTFTRAVEIIHSSDGTQGPRETFVDALEFNAKAKMLFEDNSDLNRFLTYAQAAVVATLTQPSALGGAALAVTATKASWKKATIDRSGKYASLDVEIDGVYNATDGGPAQLTLNGPQVAAY